MKTQFTPGPWAVNKENAQPMVGKPLNDGGPMLPICNTVSGYDDAQCKANARAIAALPDLVAALEASHEALYSAYSELMGSGADPKVLASYAERYSDAISGGRRALAKVKG